MVTHRECLAIVRSAVRLSVWCFSRTELPWDVPYEPVAGVPWVSYLTWRLGVVTVSIIGIYCMHCFMVGGGYMHRSGRVFIPLQRVLMAIILEDIQQLDLHPPRTRPG